MISCLFIVWYLQMCNYWAYNNKIRSKVVETRVRNLFVTEDQNLPSPPPQISWDQVVLPRRLSGKESACQCKRHKRLGFNSWVWTIPWSRKWQPTPVFLLGKSHGQRSLAIYSPWSHKQSDTTEQLSTLRANLCFLDNFKDNFTWVKKKREYKMLFSN